MEITPNQQSMYLMDRIVVNSSNIIDGSEFTDFQSLIDLLGISDMDGTYRSPPVEYYYTKKDVLKFISDATNEIIWISHPESNIYAYIDATDKTII